MNNRKITTLPERYSKGFLDKLDGRIEIARELKAAYEEVTSDLGGVDSLSHVKRALVGRFVWLTAILRGIEKQIAEADEGQAGELLGKWVQGLNSLTGLARAIGMDRKARKTDLRSYVEGVRK